MGTRGLTMVMVDNEYKVAQYGQWDHYPEGAGATILGFLRETDIKSFKDKVRACTHLTSEAVEKLWDEAGADESGFVTPGVSGNFQEKHPQLHRDAGPDVLEIIRDSDSGVPLFLQDTFVADSLFCEWAYVVDLDLGIFEVYEGFNKEPLRERDRFFSYTPLSEESVSGYMYYPVRLAAAFSLSRLPTEEVFLAIFKESD